MNYTLVLRYGGQRRKYQLQAEIESQNLSVASDVHVRLNSSLRSAVSDENLEQKFTCVKTNVL